MQLPMKIGDKKLIYSLDLISQIFKKLTHYITELPKLFQTIKEDDDRKGIYINLALLHISSLVPRHCMLFSKEFSIV